MSAPRPPLASLDNTLALGIHVSGGASSTHPCHQKSRRPTRKILKWLGLKKKEKKSCLKDPSASDVCRESLHDPIVNSLHLKKGNVSDVPSREHVDSAAQDFSRANSALASSSSSSSKSPEEQKQTKSAGDNSWRKMTATQYEKYVAKLLVDIEHETTAKLATETLLNIAKQLDGAGLRRFVPQICCESADPRHVRGANTLKLFGSMPAACGEALVPYARVITGALVRTFRALPVAALSKRTAAQDEAAAAAAPTPAWESALSVGTSERCRLISDAVHALVTQLGAASRQKVLGDVVSELSLFLDDPTDTVCFGAAEALLRVLRSDEAMLGQGGRGAGTPRKIRATPASSGAVGSVLRACARSLSAQCDRPWMQSYLALAHAALQRGALPRPLDSVALANAVARHLTVRMSADAMSDLLGLLEELWEINVANDEIQDDLREAWTSVCSALVPLAAGSKRARSLLAMLPGGASIAHLNADMTPASPDAAAMAVDGAAATSTPSPPMTSRRLSNSPPAQSRMAKLFSGWPGWPLLKARTPRKTDGQSPLNEVDLQTSVPSEVATASRPLFARAAGLGYAPAMYRLAEFDLQGDPDAAEALNTKRAAIRLGYVPGQRYGPQTAVGGIMPVDSSGTGAAKANFTPDFSAFVAAAQREGTPHACFGLGHCLEYGLGCPCDYVAAAEWYGKAAEAGHAPSMHSLGLLYETARVPPPASSPSAERPLVASAEKHSSHSASPPNESVSGRDSIHQSRSSRSSSGGSEHMEESVGSAGNEDASWEPAMHWKGWPGGEPPQITPSTVASVRVSVNWNRPTPHIGCHFDDTPAASHIQQNGQPSQAAAAFTPLSPITASEQLVEEPIPIDALDHEDISSSPAAPRDAGETVGSPLLSALVDDWNAPADWNARLSMSPIAPVVQPSEDVVRSCSPVPPEDRQALERKPIRGQATKRAASMSPREEVPPSHANNCSATTKERLAKPTVAPAPKMTRKSLAATEAGRARRARAAAMAAEEEDPYAAARERLRQQREKRTSYGHVVSALNRARKAYLSKAAANRGEAAKKKSGVAFGRTTNAGDVTTSLGPTGSARRATLDGNLFRARSCDTPGSNRDGETTPREQLREFLTRAASPLNQRQDESGGIAMDVQDSTVYEPFTFTIPRGADGAVRNPLLRSASTPTPHYQAVTIQSPDNSAVFRSPTPSCDSAEETNAKLHNNAVDISSAEAVVAVLASFPGMTGSAPTPSSSSSSLSASPAATESQSRPSLAAAVEQEIDALAALMATPAPPRNDASTSSRSTSVTPEVEKAVDAIVEAPLEDDASSTPSSQVPSGPVTPETEDRATPGSQVLAKPATPSDTSAVVAAVLAEEMTAVAQELVELEMPGLHGGEQVDELTSEMMKDAEAMTSELMNEAEAWAAKAGLVLVSPPASGSGGGASSLDLQEAEAMAADAALLLGRECPAANGAGSSIDLEEAEAWAANAAKLWSQEASIIDGQTTSFVPSSHSLNSSSPKQSCPSARQGDVNIVALLRDAGQVVVDVLSRDEVAHSLAITKSLARTSMRMMIAALRSPALRHWLHVIRAQLADASEVEPMNPLALAIARALDATLMAAAMVIAMAPGVLFRLSAAA